MTNAATTIQQFSLPCFCESTICFFNQPFPEDRSWSRRLTINAIIAVFIALFLYAFAPFDLDQAPGHLWGHALVYGGITFAVCIVFDALYRMLGIRTEVPSWTFGSWFIDVLLLILTIAAANAVYTVHIGGGELRFDFLVGMLGRTAMIAVFPVAVSGLRRIRSETARYTGISQDLQPQESVPTLASASLVDIQDDRGEVLLSISTDDVLYVESQKNYVLMHRKSQADPTRVRITLSGLIPCLEPHGLILCHRSYAVNRSAITQVTGNAQGLRLHLFDTDDVVPVSRSYVAVIREALS